MEKKYEPKIIEPMMQKLWRDLNIFKFNPKTQLEIFSIDTPPPTVSGTLHVGHVFSYSQMEFIARYKRMKGFHLFYPFGFDNNGLATEILTEKELGIRSEDMTRKEFIEKVQEVEKKYRKNYKKVWETLGISCDWSLLYDTIEERVRKITQLSFLELVKNKRAYREESPAIWCTKCATAIAQAELEDKETSSVFNELIFKLKGKGEIKIATTRPELLSSCVAIFVSPDDNENKKLVGKKAIVPLFGQEVPIIEDYRVDPEKGTGIVMCCTFGDLNDIEWFKAHKLPLKISIDKNGKMTELAGKYQGKFVKQARKEIIEDLKKEGVLTDQKTITHIVNVHERCGMPIEFLVTKQWFIKYLDLKKKFLDNGKKVEWHPEFMKVRFDNWINGLQWDWSISRQRYYGVPIPVWYCEECDEPIFADEKNLPIDPLQDKPKVKCKCGSNKIKPEEDVFDTWMTSSMTPLINAKWKEKDNLMDKIFPMNLRPQAHDIITFWAFNTIVKSHLHEKNIPWKNIMISGHGLDSKGKKMSKSKGNVVFPLDVVENYSADALRFWAASAKLGDDLPYNEKDVATGQKTITKLWNSARFLEMNLKDFNGKKPRKLRAVDKWILSKLMKLIKKSTEKFDAYEYSHTKMYTEIFFWKDFCDNYLEFIKYRLYDNKDKESALWTYYFCLMNITKLFAPFMPHVTEKIYQELFRGTEKHSSIHISEWPKYNSKIFDEQSERAGDLLKTIVSGIRQWKQKKGLPLNAPLKKVVIKVDKEYRDELGMIIDEIEGIMKVELAEEGKASAIELTDYVTIDILQ